METFFRAFCEKHSVFKDLSESAQKRAKASSYIRFGKRNGGGGGGGGGGGAAEDELIEGQEVRLLVLPEKVIVVCFFSCGRSLADDT